MDEKPYLLIGDVSPLVKTVVMTYDERGLEQIKKEYGLSQGKYFIFFFSSRNCTVAFSKWRAISAKFFNLFAIPFWTWNDKIIYKEVLKSLCLLSIISTNLLANR